jgi:hypothetical protein
MEKWDDQRGGEIPHEPAGRQRATHQGHRKRDGEFPGRERMARGEPPQGAVDQQDKQEQQQDQPQREVVSDEERVPQRVVVVRRDAANDDHAD